MENKPDGVRKAPTHELIEATRLAADGKYRCRKCGKIDEQEKGIVVAFAGAVVFAICPSCIEGHIRIERHGGIINVAMPRPRDSRIVLADDLPKAGLQVATPKIERVKL